VAEPVTAVIVDALGAPPDRGLDAALGAEGAAAVRAALRDRARRWARAVGGDRAFEATSVEAALAAVHGHAGPVVLAAPDIPRMDTAVARDALDDLRAGCDLALGAAHDGRPYIVALSRLDDELLAVELEPFGAGGLLGTLEGRGLVLGLLRAERRLTTADDARALALDPLAPPDLRALVTGATRL
jgi:hypothetical protein